MIPVVYIIGGILVRTGAKKVAEQLIKAGAKKATQKIIQSFKGKVQNATPTNINTIIKKAKQGPPQWQGPRIVRQGPNKPPTTGGSKPLSVNKPSAAPKPGPATKANQQPRLSSGSSSPTVVKIKPKPATSSSSTTSTIAGLVGAFALGAGAYEEYKRKNSPTNNQIEIAERKIRAAAKDNGRQASKEGSLVGTAGTESKRQKARRRPEKRNLENKRGFKPDIKNYQSEAQDMVDARYTGSGVPTLTDTQRIKLKKELAEITKKKSVRPKLRPKAEPMSLRSYLNAEIKSRKSTVTKEKAKAKKGDYKSIAEAKKAKSLYYIKDGKPMAAVYKRDLKGL